MHDKVKVTNDQRKKPHVHVIYDNTKGGVDIVDLLSTNHFNQNEIEEMAFECTCICIGNMQNQS